ncbi:hypothetical protein [Niastella sp. OAS944]|uniref:hypothetical protein n=1 Tax=Niastella sp. OAS944 TaxID=2664089 RepID=UPI00347E67A4|nr:hypothetical protein [Chitinophagaceae bacterium OAS944]
MSFFRKNDLLPAAITKFPGKQSYFPENSIIFPGNWLISRRIVFVFREKDPMQKGNERLYIETYSFSGEMDPFSEETDLHAIEKGGSKIIRGPYKLTCNIFIECTTYNAYENSKRYKNC